MTLNNLETHLSWLLIAKPTPSIRAVGPCSDEASNAVQTLYAADRTNTTGSHIISSTRSARIPTNISNVGEASKASCEPPIRPSLAASRQSQTRTTLPAANMARLNIGMSSKRPTLMSHARLATPDSTTAPISLTASYTASLQKSAQSPFTANSIPRTSAASIKQPPTPQTPQSTTIAPWQTPKLPNGESLEAVDLTGESHSGSSITEFGESRRLWTADSASRPEPLEKPSSRKKRKSDDNASGRSVKRRSIEPAYPSLDEFADIDDMDEDFNSDSPTQRRPSAPLSPHDASQSGDAPFLAAPMKPSIENQGEQVNFAPNCNVTETISNAQTRTARSWSRTSSAQLVSTVELHSAPCPSQSDDRKSRSVRRSPDKRDLFGSQPSNITSKQISPSTKSNNAEQGAHGRQRRVVQDSDDESDLDTKTISKISKIQLAQGERVPCDHLGTTKSPRRHHLTLPSISTVPKAENNFATISSQQHQHSPTRIHHVTAKPTPPSSQPSSSGSCAIEEKKLVESFLVGEVQLRAIQVEIERQLEDSAARISVFMEEYMQPPPTEFRLERQSLVDKKNALVHLTSLRGPYSVLQHNHRELHMKLIESMDSGSSTTEIEAEVVDIAKKKRDLETQICQSLHKAGAIAAGFANPLQVQLQPRQSETATAAPSEPRQMGSAMHSSLHTTTQTMRTQIPQARTTASFSYQVPGFEAISEPRYVSPHVPSLDYRQHSGHADVSRRAAYDKSKIAREEPDHDFDDEILAEAMQSDDGHRGEYEDDEFGEFDYDEEMLQFTADVESSTLPPKSRLDTPRPRQALSELSLNANAAQTSIKVKISENMYDNVDAAHTNMMNKPWSKDVKKALKDRFRLRGFRQNQLESINATLNGEDVFVLMPTGGGKSLCYQLPAVIQSGRTKGITIVISPLLSLMQDQVDHLRKVNIQASLLNGEVTAEYRKSVLTGLREKHPEQFIELLYVTPEMIGKSAQINDAMANLHRRGKIARIVIDEAHCVSQWGHDFRPDYKALGDLRNSLPGVPFMALTATATENCKSDVIHNLGIGGCKVYTQSFNRPNLTYEVRPKKKKAEVMDGIADLVKTQYKNQCGIIYALSRKECEKIAEVLTREYGIEAKHYHAALDPKDKITIQKDWQSGKFFVIVATIAFGMGIDKPDVRFVIHYTIPKSLEGYYQETGRAGRDGKKSGCYLYYGYQDTAILQRFIEEGEGNQEQKDRQRKMLQRMVAYCENKCDCRRVEILRYFNESFSKEQCNHTCDNCNSDSAFETVDYTDIARGALTMVKAAFKKNITATHCVDALRGSKGQKLVQLGLDGVGGFGCASHMQRGEVERLVYRLISEEALQETNVTNKSGFVHAYIILGAKYSDILYGRRPLKMQVRVSTSPKHNSPSKAKKKGTKIAASLKNGHPQSTNVSSPIRARDVRRERNPYIDDEAGQADDADSDGDGFVIDDEEDESDGFEPVREAGQRHSRRAGRASLGPPITRDATMDSANLNDIHQQVMEALIAETKALEEDIKMRHGLRKHLFTESQRRQMAIDWTTTAKEILAIKGVDKDRVERHAARFAALVNRHHENYESMMGIRDEHDLDQNHQNVIDLVSDEELESDFIDDDEEVESDGEPSKFFQPPAVRAFNESLPEPYAKQASRPSLPSSQSKSRSGGSSWRGGRGGRGGFRKSSGSRSRNGKGSAGTASGVQRRASGGKRNSGGSKSTTSQNGIMASFGRKSGSGGASGASGIGAYTFGKMPT